MNNSTVCPDNIRGSKYNINEKKVYTYIHDCGSPVSPKTISLKTEINYSTIRGICSKLLRENIVEQDTRGYYFVRQPTHEVRDKEDFRFENMMLSYYVKEKQVESSEEEFLVGSLRLKITFGYKHNKITCRITDLSGKGLTYREVLFSSFVLCNQINKKLNIEVKDSDIEIRNIEVNNDLISQRLEGIQCLTITYYQEVMEKFYNKTNPMRLRIEKRPLKSFSATDLYNSMSYGAMYTEIYKKYESLEKSMGEIKSEQTGVKNLCKAILNILPKLRMDCKKLSDVLCDFRIPR